MSDNYPVSEEFRSWVKAGIERQAKWLLVYYSYSEYLDFADFCNDAAELELKRAEDRHYATKGADLRLVGVHDLQGTEQEVIRRIQRTWAAAAHSSLDN